MSSRSTPPGIGSLPTPGESKVATSAHSESCGAIAHSTSVNCGHSRMRGWDTRPISHRRLGLVEKAALEEAGLLLGGDLDVLGCQQEDPLGDPLHAATEGVGHARGEVDQPLRELAVGRLKIDDHRLRALELVGDLLGVVEASWGDDVHRGDASAVARGSTTAASAAARLRLLSGVLHRANESAARRRLIVPEDVVDVLFSSAAAPAPGALDRFPRRGSLIERHLAAGVALVVLALLDVVALNEAEVLK